LIRQGFTSEEAAEYRAINHDIEELRAQHGALLKRKSGLLEKVYARTNDMELLRLSALSERSVLNG
jgi:hypothetical protein